MDESPGSDFTNYFLAFPMEGQSLTKEEKKASKLSREGVLELCHNHGTESDPEFKGYANGNEGEGRGFGHLAISVDGTSLLALLTAFPVHFFACPTSLSTLFWIISACTKYRRKYID